MEETWKRPLDLQRIISDYERREAHIDGLRDDAEGGSSGTAKEVYTAKAF